MIGLGVHTCKNCVHVLTAEWVWPASVSSILQKVIANVCAVPIPGDRDQGLIAPIILGALTTVSVQQVHVHCDAYVIVASFPVFHTSPQRV